MILTSRLNSLLTIVFASLLISPAAFAKKDDAKKTEATKKEEVKKDDAKKDTKKPDDGSFICPEKKPDLKVFPRADVYKTTPYKAGEMSEYEVRYMGALAGSAKIEVRSPVNHPLSDGKQYWHRNFHVDAKTGDWYKLIFVAHDQIDAVVRPWDSSISRFYMDQDEGKLFGRRFKQKKWLDFVQEKCVVNERTQKEGKDEKKESFDLSYGTMDTLGVAFWLREQTFKVGKNIRTMVYSSEKNWWLEAQPLAIEKIKTKAGEFEAIKIRLQTYIGKELQQKGDVNVWIATNTPQKQLILIQAEIKLGSVWIELEKYDAGRG